MSRNRRQYGSEFKAKVALAALKGDEATSALAMIDPPSSATPRLGRRNQLLGISRSAPYRQQREWLAEDLALMCVIDEPYLLIPVSGSRRMTGHLNRLGCRVTSQAFTGVLEAHGVITSMDGKLGYVGPGGLETATTAFPIRANREKR